MEDCHDAKVFSPHVGWTGCAHSSIGSERHKFNFERSTLLTRWLGLSQSAFSQGIFAILASTLLVFMHSVKDLNAVSAHAGFGSG